MLESYHSLQVALILALLKSHGVPSTVLAIKIRIFSWRLQVTTPSGIPVDVDIGRPAIQAQVREIVAVIFAVVCQPECSQLYTCHSRHVAPEAAIPSRTLRIGIWKACWTLAATTRLDTMNAIGSPVILWHSKAWNCSHRRLARCQ